MLISMLGGVRPRIHATAFSLLNEHFVNDFIFYSDANVWQALATRAESIYIICRAPLGSQELARVPGDFTRDPKGSRSAFDDVISMMRFVFTNAAKDVPSRFFNFAQSTLTKNSRAQGDRNIVLLELMQLAMPDFSVPSSYINAETVLYRNYEDFVIVNHTNEHAHAIIKEVPTRLHIVIF